MKLSISLASVILLLIISACKDLPIASFTISTDSPDVGDTVHFQSTSTNALTYEWDFGDEHISSEENPSHSYTSAGLFTIQLAVSNEDGTDETSKSIEVQMSYPCWEELAGLHTPTQTHMMAVVNDRIYVLGGEAGVVVEEYDPSNDTWTQKADLPTPRSFLSGCSINGKIYAIGGWKGTGFGYSVSLNSIEEYDPSTDTWTKKAPMPTARWGHASVAFEGKVYVIGGARDWPVEEFYNSAEIYDPETDTWTTKSFPPTATMKPRWGYSACEVNGKIYLIGGNYATNYTGKDTVPGLQLVEEYNPVTNTWAKKSNMPTARYSLATAVFNDAIYAIGGGDTYYPANALQTVEKYDPATNTWNTKSPMPAGRIFCVAGELNGMIYVPGGGGAGEDELYSDLFVYDPACDMISNR